MDLGLERSEMAYFYFPQNTDILIFFQFEVGQKGQSYQFQRDLTDKSL